MPKKARTKRLVYLTDRALRDIVGIEFYSVERHGKRVASQYISKLEAGIRRVAENPELLRTEASFHCSLKFYRIEQHLLACETAIAGKIIVLTVLHASMDVPSRLVELEPNLSIEVEMLLKQLQRASEG